MKKIGQEPITRFLFHVNTGYPFQPGETREVNCMPQVPFRGNGFEVPENIRKKFRVKDLRVGLRSMFDVPPPEGSILLADLVGVPVDLEPTVPGIYVTLILECVALEPTMFADVFLLGEEVEYETIGSLPLRVPYGEGRMSAFANILRLVASEIEASDRRGSFVGERFTRRQRS